MLSDSSMVNAGASTSVVIVLGPLAPRETPISVTVWCDPSDNLAGDAFTFRAVVTDRPQAAGDLGGLRSQYNGLLSAVSAPGMFRLPLGRVKGRWCTCLFTVDNTGGATPYRFGAALDYEKPSAPSAPTFVAPAPAPAAPSSAS